MSDAVRSPVGVNGRNQAAWNFIRATLWQTNNLQSRHHTLLLQSFLIKFSFGTSKCARNIFSPVLEDFMSVVMHLIHKKLTLSTTNFYRETVYSIKNYLHINPTEHLELNEMGRCVLQPSSNVTNRNKLAFEASLIRNNSSMSFQCKTNRCV